MPSWSMTDLNQSPAALGGTRAPGSTRWLASSKITTLVCASFNWSAMRLNMTPDVMPRCGRGTPRAVKTLTGSSTGEMFGGMGTTRTGTWRTPNTLVG